MGPAEYRTASLEHVTAARSLYQSGRYPLGIYVAGLAAECMLRAYVTRFSAEFDARHDLKELFRQGLARLSGGGPEPSASLSTLYVLWRNDHRFRPESSLRAFLKERKLFLKVKGDPLKEACRRAVEASFRLVTYGDTRWTT